jgi:hypothetical protein
MKILSIYKETIKQFGRSDYEKRPFLRFHLEFINEYTGQIDNLYLFACVFYENKPLFYGVSSEPDCQTISSWRTQICYAIKDFMNDPLSDSEKHILLSNNTIHELSQLVYNHMIDELGPGYLFQVVKEPKDAKRVLKQSFPKQSFPKQSVLKEETNLYSLFRSFCCKK